VKKSRKIDKKYFKTIEVDMEQKYHTNQIFSNKSQTAVALSCNDNLSFIKKLIRTLDYILKMLRLFIKHN